MKIKRTFPKKIGTAVDRLYEVRAERQRLQRAANEVKGYESELHEHLIRNFKKSELEGAEGAVARCGLNPKTVARVTDWSKFWKYVVKKKAFDLVQQRVNDKAYLDRLEDGERVTGAEPFRITRVSVTKRRKR